MGYSMGSAPVAIHIVHNQMRGTMSVCQADLLRFAVQWAPYEDDGDEHIYPMFGLEIEEFHRRLLYLLDTPAAHSLDSATIQRLRRSSLLRVMTMPTRPVIAPRLRQAQAGADSFM